MNRYRLVLVPGAPAPEKSGYVFCADGEGARTAARQLLQSHPAYRAVRIHDGDLLVCEIARDRPAEAAE